MITVFLKARPFLQYYCNKLKSMDNLRGPKLAQHPKPH